MEKARIILLLSLIVSLIGAFEAVAITWEFEEEGDTQGWYARESFLSGTSSSSLSFLRSEVRDGFWRFDVLPFKTGRIPSVGLIWDAEKLEISGAQFLPDFVPIYLGFKCL